MALSPTDDGGSTVDASRGFPVSAAFAATSGTSETSEMRAAAGKERDTHPPKEGMARRRSSSLLKTSVAAAKRTAAGVRSAVVSQLKNDRSKTRRSEARNNASSATHVHPSARSPGRARADIPHEQLRNHRRGGDSADRGRVARARRPAPPQRGARGPPAPLRPGSRPRPTTPPSSGPPAARGGPAPVPELGGGRARHVRAHQHATRRLVGDVQAPAAAPAAAPRARGARVRNLPRQLRHQGDQREERQGHRPVRTGGDADRDGGASGGGPGGESRHANKGHHQGQPGKHGQAREAHRPVLGRGRQGGCAGCELCQILRRAQSRGGGVPAEHRPDRAAPTDHGGHARGQPREGEARGQDPRGGFQAHAAKQQLLRRLRLQHPRGGVHAIVHQRRLRRGSRRRRARGRLGRRQETRAGVGFLGVVAAVDARRRSRGRGELVLPRGDAAAEGSGVHAPRRGCRGGDGARARADARPAVRDDDRAAERDAAPVSEPG